MCRIYFYSRPCGRGDLLQLRLWLRVTVFLLTPLREGRPVGSAPGRLPHLFLLTPLREGRPKRIKIFCVNVLFLLTPLREGRPADHLKYLAHCEFLLTPLREGRQQRGYRVVGEYCISTHAPAGGATMVRQKPGRFRNISTHAPAGGATSPFR